MRYGKQQATRCFHRSCAASMESCGWVGTRRDPANSLGGGPTLSSLDLCQALQAVGHPPISLSVSTPGLTWVCNLLLSGCDLFLSPGLICLFPLYIDRCCQKFAYICYQKCWQCGFLFFSFSLEIGISFLFLDVLVDYFYRVYGFPHIHFMHILSVLYLWILLWGHSENGIVFTISNSNYTFLL